MFELPQGQTHGPVLFNVLINSIFVFVQKSFIIDILMITIFGATLESELTLFI